MSAAVVATGGALGRRRSASSVRRIPRSSTGVGRRRVCASVPARRVDRPPELCHHREGFAIAAALPRAHTSRSSAAPSSRSSQQLPPLLQPASTPSSRARCRACRRRHRRLPPQQEKCRHLRSRHAPLPRLRTASEHATFTIEIVPDADADTAAPAVNSECRQCCNCRRRRRHRRRHESARSC